MLSVLTFRTPSEAVEKANNTPYGLSAGVWTDKGSLILWMTSRLRAGVVWANTFNKFDPASPFGGYKESGYGREGGRHGLGGLPRCLTSPPRRRQKSPPARLAVRKTYKLYIGGAFPRSESGRSYPVTDHKDGFLANAALASRKDARDAVTAARKALAGWSGATAYNRGQVLYRVAELLEGRRAQFAAEVRAAEGLGARAAEAVVDAVIDRWVWYAGWADKIAQVRGAANPVAGPYYNFSLPEPTGVAAVLAPGDSSLLGFVSVIAPAVVSGNTVVALASESRPLPAVTLSEVLATSDVPGGVINILTGRTVEIAPWLASHMDVNAIDLTGADDSLADELAVAAADNLKRVIRPRPCDGDWTGRPSLHRLHEYLETKTVWHPIGT